MLEFLQSNQLISKAVATVIVGVLFILLRKLILFFLRPQIKDVRVNYRWTKLTTYFFYVLFGLVIIPVWINELSNASTFIGLLSAGLAVALKDPISNLFAWIYIVIRKPFEMGDRIQINDSEGDVLDIGLFEFTLLEIKNWVMADQSTGRIIHIPNGLVFNREVVNYHQGMNYIWHEIPIVVTFESDWEKAKKILVEIENSKLKGLLHDSDEILKTAKNKFHVSYSEITPTVYTRIKDEGVQLTLRYLCNPRMRRDSEQNAYEAILKEFAKHPDIQFAYPTTRFYNATIED